MQKAFNNFVSSLREELHAVDVGSSPRVCDQHSKCQEKVRIYERFTAGLIKNATKYLEIIKHLKSELKHNTESSTDCTSDSESSVTSSVTPSDADDKFNHIDLNYLKDLLSRKNSEEKRALESLRKLETTLQSLKLENRKLSAEKNELETRLIESKKATPGMNPDTSTINFAKILAQENEQLRQIIARNESTLKSMVNKGTGSSNLDDDDCSARVNELQRQLNEKEKLINDLKKSITKKNETKSNIDELKGHQSHVNRLVGDESNNMNDDSGLTESEMNDNNKLNLLMEGHRQLSALVKEKYAQLRQQRAEIKSLKMELEEYERKERQSKERSSSQARKDVNQHADQIEKQKRQIDLANERESILARKVAIQKDHIRELIEERLKLIQMNNDIMNTIAVCKRELAKHNV